jgi:hypothetical protein
MTTEKSPNPSPGSHKLPPLQAVRQHCLWCCNDSPKEVRLCASKGCPLWPYRFGKKPTEELLAEVRDVPVYPLEAEQTGQDVEGRSALKAIKSRCRDCSGGCPAEVKACKFTECSLHPYRLGRSGRKLSEAQKEAAADRARALVQHRSAEGV